MPLGVECTVCGEIQWSATQAGRLQTHHIFSVHVRASRGYGLCRTPTRGFTNNSLPLRACGGLPCQLHLQVLAFHAEYQVTSKQERKRAWAIVERGQPLGPDENVQVSSRTSAAAGDGAGKTGKYGNRPPCGGTRATTGSFSSTCLNRLVGLW